MPQLENLHSEKRRYRRIATSIPMNLVADKRNVRAEAINLSMSGVCCRVDRPIDMMTCLEVVLLLPEEGAPDEVKYLECEGIVVRNEKTADGYHIAIFFSDIAIDAMRKLTAYIAAHGASAC
jgi:hypothetical protein